MFSSVLRILIRLDPLHFCIPDPDTDPGRQKSAISRLNKISQGTNRAPLFESVIQANRSSDPDPYGNETDPQHWFLLIYSPVFQDHWNALVQVRQKTQQRKTLFYVEQLLIKYNATKVKGDELNMAVSFWYLGKSDLSSLHVYTVQFCTLFPRYKKNTAMFNWSPCTHSTLGTILINIRIMDS